MAENRDVLDRLARGPDREWAYGSSPDQVAEAYLPDTPTARPVVMIHGGFWRPAYDRTHLRPFAQALCDAGRQVILPEYSRVPGDPDRMVADLRTCLADLPPEVSQPDPIVAGHSAGGHLALLLAGDPPMRIHGCLALAPVADLQLADDLDLDGGAVRDFLGGPAAGRADLDPVRASAPTVPVTVLHGVADSLVPLALSESYHSSRGGRLVRLPRAGHFELIDPQAPTWDAVLGELDALDH